MAPRSNPETVTLLSTEHILVMGLIAVCTAALVGLLRWTAGRSTERMMQRTVCWGLAAILLLAAAAGQIHQVYAGTWTLQDSLPLHLCNIGLLVAAVTLVGVGRLPRREAPRASLPTTSPAQNPPSALSIWQRLYELAYFWGIGGTTQAIVTPDVEGRFPAFTCLRYFVEHGGLITAVLTLMFGLGMRPLRGALLRTWVTTLLLAVVVLVIDVGLGANYMYLLGPPENPTLYDAFGPWPWALLSLVLVGTLIFLLCYAPFWLLDRRAGSGRQGLFAS